MSDRSPLALPALSDAVAAAGQLPSLQARPVLDLPTVTADLTVVLDLAQHAAQTVAELTARIPAAAGPLTELTASITAGSRAAGLLSTAGTHLSRIAAVMATPRASRSADEVPFGVLAAHARACIAECAAHLAAHPNSPASPNPQQLRATAATRRSPGLPPLPAFGQGAPPPTQSPALATVLPFHRRS